MEKIPFVNPFFPITHHITSLPREDLILCVCVCVSLLVEKQNEENPIKKFHLPLSALLTPGGLPRRKELQSSFFIALRAESHFLLFSRGQILLLFSALTATTKKNCNDTEGRR